MGKCRVLPAAGGIACGNAVVPKCRLSLGASFGGHFRFAANRISFRGAETVGFRSPFDEFGFVERARRFPRLLFCALMLFRDARAVEGASVVCGFGLGVGECLSDALGLSGVPAFAELGKRLAGTCSDSFGFAGAGTFRAFGRRGGLGNRLGAALHLRHQRYDWAHHCLRRRWPVAFPARLCLPGSCPSDREVAKCIKLPTKKRAPVRERVFCSSCLSLGLSSL